MAEVIVPFSLTNAQVLTLDTVSVAIAQFGVNTGTGTVKFNTDNSRIVYVPKYLVIAKDADTAAFALTRGLPHGTNDGATTNRPLVDRRGVPSLAYRYTVDGGEALLVVRDSYGEPCFYIPADRLLQTVAASSMLCLPMQEGREFFGNQFEFTIRSNNPIATGTVGLRGRLVFEQYSLNA